MGSPAVEVVDLVKHYGEVHAVAGLSLTVDPGSVTAVLGPNGAGKTTTIECCEGYRRPDSGSVRVLGLNPVADARQLRPRVGVMLQDAGLPPTARPPELLRAAAAMYAHPLPIESLVQRLGLGATARTAVRRLSGGQRQRLALALAVIGRPELVFLDEPTAGLDPQARHATWALVEQLRTDGVTVVLTTHLIDEAERLADQVVVVDAGRVVAEGSPRELVAGPAEDHLRFAGPAQLPIASLAAALPEGSAVTEVAAGHYRVDGEMSPQLLATVTTWCAGHGVMPEGLSVQRRTLEDVFLELTGREMRS